jgi:predicted O-methyltransferase YrrM
MTRGRERVERLAEVCLVRSKTEEERLFLFKIVRFLQPSRCLELGTCLGISAAYIGSALKLNGAGDLTSIEGCPTLVQIAKRNLRDLNLGNITVRNGRFQDILSRELMGDCFDFVFVDGHHDRDATILYFNQIATNRSAVIVFGDIPWPDGMKEAWRYIGNSKLLIAHAEFEGCGVCVAGTAFLTNPSRGIGVVT